jgi:crotonobetainyl-CoA hydratase
MAEVVRVQKLGDVVMVTIDRPKVNAIDQQTSRLLGDVFGDYQADRNLRCAVIAGTGRFFSAGWDLKAGAAGIENEGSDFGIGGFAGLTE